MLYEIALPGLILKSYARRLFARGNLTGKKPALRLRADRGRLRRTEIRLASRMSPTLAALIALRRLEAVNPALRKAIHASHGAALLRTKSGKVFARLVGKMDAPRLLVLHGWNADGTMMLPLARDLAEAGFGVILPDLVSPGLTASRRLDVQRVARRIVAECGRFGPYEAVIGHSAGGLVGAVAAREGLRAGRLVTISSSASVACLLTGYLTFIAAPELLKPAMLRLYARLRGRDPANIGPEDFRRFGTAHLVIHAGNDWQVSPRAAERICEGRPGMTPVIMSGCNHQSVLRHPELSGLIHNFVTGTTPTGAAQC